MEIKRKVQKNLPQLIKWVIENKKFGCTYISNNFNKVYVTDDGIIEFSGLFYGDTFTVEVEEEITKDTVIPKLMTTFRKICLKNGTGYQRVRIDENYSIKLMLNKAEAHSEPVETLHIVNDDGTHTLVWRNGKMVE